MALPGNTFGSSPATGPSANARQSRRTAGRLRGPAALPAL